MTTIKAQLEVDHSRGVIYVHDETGSVTLIRICNLPNPIPFRFAQIDITHMVGVSITPLIVPIDSRITDTKCTGANDGTCPEHPEVDLTERQLSDRVMSLAQTRPARSIGKIASC